jgi:hypothetical protein
MLGLIRLPQSRWRMVYGGASINALGRRNAMTRAVFLLLRLICYPALVIVGAAAIAVLIVYFNGQCPPISEIGVTCTTAYSQLLGDYGVVVGVFTLNTGFPIVLAFGGLVFLLRDLRRNRADRS